MRVWLAYATAALAVAVAGGFLGVLFAAGPVARGVWVAAGLAWVVQLIAFGMLLRAQSSGREFMLGWLGGMVLRMVVVAGVAIWVTRTGALPPRPTLVSLVVLVFVMLLLEPLFLKRGRTTA